MHFGETAQQAAKQYRCDQCGHPIGEGDVYLRSLWMPLHDRIIVLRCHSSPDCPAPDDFEDRSDEMHESPALRLAA